MTSARRTSSPRTVLTQSGVPIARFRNVRVSELFGFFFERRSGFGGGCSRVFYVVRVRFGFVALKSATGGATFRRIRVSSKILTVIFFVSVFGSDLSFRTLTKTEFPKNIF